VQQNEEEHPKDWYPGLCGVVKPFGLFSLRLGLCFHAEICFLSKSVMMEIRNADIDMTVIFFLFVNICLAIKSIKERKMDQLKLRYCLTMPLDKKNHRH